jgi:hypothetical protein
VEKILKENNLPSLIKKLLLLGIAIGTLIGSIIVYKKDANDKDKNRTQIGDNKKPVVKNKSKNAINIITRTPSNTGEENYGENIIKDENTMNETNSDLGYKKIDITNLEKPAGLEKPIEFFKNLDFIKSNFYVLDKSNKLKPTLYEITKEGKIVSAEIVGIGKEEGDGTVGMTTPAGVYIFSKWIEQEDLDLYGKEGIFRLLGYPEEGKTAGNKKETVNDIGVHIIYPPEKETRTMAMLNPESSKEISHRCINVFPEYFKSIKKNYAGEGTEFIFIMQEKNAFDEGQWGKITQEMSKDVKKLTEADKNNTD